MGLIFHTINVKNQRINKITIIGKELSTLCLVPQTLKQKLFLYQEEIAASKNFGELPWMSVIPL